MLSRLGFDPARDDVDSLYASVRDLRSLEALVEIAPPRDWAPVIERFVQWLDISMRLELYRGGVYELARVFALGARLERLDPHLKRQLRNVFLGLPEYEAQSLFKLLKNPSNMDRALFLELLVSEKVAQRLGEWAPQIGATRKLWEEMAAAEKTPASGRRLAKTRLARPVERETTLVEAGEDRVVSREELYDLVWSESMRTLAARFGLSDNGLRKRCKAMNIPTPGRGYWRMLETGKRVRKPPALPNLEGRGEETSRRRKS